jgi:tRNA-specific 2-thiouridylase
MASPTQKLRVALGMSGGVDSSLSAHLLLEAGYEVVGVYLECWRAPGCRTDEDRKDALSVALQLNISFQVLDFKNAYRDKVVEYFFTEYTAGRTPNPDVMCNKEIKFGLFYTWAMENGFDYVATGHYAQNAETGSQFTGKTFSSPLLSATDAHKDQTYFLYQLQREQFQHILFPIGHLTKPEVRQEAQRRKIPVANKKDSVGICFIGDINVHSFLKERLGENPGEVVDLKGNVIGRHNGLWFYTIGQRHGFSISPKTTTTNAEGELVDKHNIPPFYVIGKHAEKNQLVVGFGSETLLGEFSLLEAHWLTKVPPETQQLFVRIRHTGDLLPGLLDCQHGQYVVQLDHPHMGIAAGQSAVFYTQENGAHVCLGGGIISVQ